MKIAIISTMAGSPWAGSEELWVAMASEALNEGHEVVISTPRWPQVPLKIRELERKGAILQRRVYSYRLSFNDIVFRLTGQKMRWLKPKGDCSFKEIFSTRPNIICLSQGGTHDFWKLPDLKQRLGSTKIPFVVVCHANDETPFDPILIPQTVEFFEMASHVAFVSQGNLRGAQRQLAMNFCSASVVQNPVNLSDVSMVPWPSSSVLCMASIARLHLSSKGHDVLFEALSSPLWRAREWQLDLFGEGPDKAHIQKLVQHFGLQERIAFKGHVPDVRAIWAEHHLLVMPSRIEGTPLALIEALLCGRPALATELAGHPEWIENTKTGWLAAAPTACALGVALENVWQSRDSLQEMGVRAHQSASQRRDTKPGKSLLDLVLEKTRARV